MSSPNPIEGLRAALAELPDSALILVEDDSGGRYVLREIFTTTVEIPGVEPRLVLKVEELRADLAGSGWEETAQYVTKTGKVLTDADIEELSAEAEAETDTAHLLRSQANAARLLEGLRQARAGEAESEYCSTYCEHNADGECGCQPCAWIRENAGFVHATGCRFGHDG